MTYGRSEGIATDLSAKFRNGMARKNIAEEVGGSVVPQGSAGHDGEKDSVTEIDQ